ncbi:MAG: sensor histidine kinase [Gemmatimonadota bacterium]
MSGADDADREEGRSRQLQRLAMIGTLAAGLGHDLRNLVMPIALRLDVLDAHGLPPKARENITIIRSSLENLTRLANGLMLLSRNPFESRGETETTDLAEWWRDVCALVVDTLPSGCLVEAEIAEGERSVAVPPHVLAQVTLNLAMNASQALTGQDNPEVHIEARRIDDRVILSFSDNGAGMTAEVRERCFEPFFATGHREISTGLGLSSARSILYRYGADIRVDSEPDRGATFSMMLPLAADALHVGDSIPILARIALSDARTAAVVRLLLKSRGIPLETGRGADESLADLVVCDESTVAAERKALKNAPATRSLIAIGDAPARRDARISWIDRANLTRLLDVLNPEHRSRRSRLPENRA